MLSRANNVAGIKYATNIWNTFNESHVNHWKHKLTQFATTMSNQNIIWFELSFHQYSMSSGYKGVIIQAHKIWWHNWLKFQWILHL